MKDREERQQKVEMSLAHLEHRVEQLDAVVFEHTRTIESLSRMVEDLRAKVRRLEGRVSDTGEDDLSGGELTEGYEYGLDDEITGP